MLDDLIKEINELKEYKKKYEWALEEKKRMSDLLFEYMTKEYENTSYEKRCADFKADVCKMCRYKFNCDKDDLPIDILKPIPSENAWIPGKVSCKNFEWS